MAPIRIRAALSTASIEPNSRCKRSTLLPWVDTSNTTRPATTPPKLMAGKDRPAKIKPRAAPGSTAWDSASPIRLIRRITRIVPIGPQPSANARQPTSARRMNPNSANGPSVASYNVIGAPGSQHRADDPIGRTVAVGEGLDVDDHSFARRDPSLDRRRAHMRKQHDIVERTQTRIY